MKKSFISSLSLYIGMGIQIVFSFLISVYVIRYLSVEDYGAYKLIASIMTFAAYFTSFGLDGTLVRFIPEYLSKGNYKAVNYMIFVTLCIRISSIFLFIFLLVFFKHPIFSFLKLPDILMVWLTVICILIFLEKTKSLFGDSLLTAYLEIYIKQINVIVLIILRLILFLLVVHNDWGLAGLILSILLIDVISFIYFSIFAIKKYVSNRKKYSHGCQEDFSYRRVARFSLFSFLTVSTGVFREIMIDNFVISYYLNVSMVGLYSFAAVLVGIPRQLDPLSTLRGVYYPLLVKRYYETGEDEKILIFFYEFLNKLFFFVTIPMLLGMGLISEEIILFIYNPEYLGTLPIIYLLLIAYSIGLLSGTFTPIIKVLEKNELLFYSGMFSVYNLVMDIILVPKFGIMGAAIATGSAMVLNYFFYYYHVRKLTEKIFVFPFKFLFKSLFNFLPAVIFLLFFKPFIMNIKLIIVSIMVSALLYLTMSYFNKLFSDKERAMINNAIGKNIWVF